jgi:membrane protein insertase Oxa1/YidC/SpoIIIJ
VREFVEQFMSNFSRPLEPGRELIPTRYRVPFFIALAALSLIVLVLLVRFVVVPGIAAQQSGAASARESGSTK